MQLSTLYSSTHLLSKGVEAHIKTIKYFTKLTELSSKETDESFEKNRWSVR